MKIHVVTSGETLWSISQKYMIPIQQIIIANQLPNPNRLLVGQALVIPNAGYQHMVQPGETLWHIAQKYGTTVNAILKENNLSNPSLIYPGQILIIPNKYHVVRPGENLWSIAYMYGVGIDILARENNIENPALIYPGQVLRVPEKAKPTIEVNAYLSKIKSGEFLPTGAEGYSLVKEVGEALTYLSLFSYIVSSDGNVNNLNDLEEIKAAKSEKVSPLMVITNIKDGKFDSDVAHSFLNSNQAQETFFNEVLAIMEAKGYAGINLDFEYVLQEDKEAYNQFLRKTVSRLRPKGYSVSTAVAPKYSQEQKGLLYEAHDYKAHGEIVDFVVVMTYEWGWAGGPPWAISPINEVRKVLDYAIRVIPREKIMMGMPLYGRDWTLPYVEGGPWAEKLSPQQAIIRALNYGVRIQYHPNYEAPYYQYTDAKRKKHEVWFEDARSVQAKFNLVKEYKLRGVSYWVLGNPFPQNWLLLRDNFVIRHI